MLVGRVVAHVEPRHTVCVVVPADHARPPNCSWFLTFVVAPDFVGRATSYAPAWSRSTGILPPFMMVGPEGYNVQS